MHQILEKMNNIEKRQEILEKKLESKQEQPPSSKFKEIVSTLTKSGSNQASEKEDAPAQVRKLV